MSGPSVYKLKPTQINLESNNKSPASINISSNQAEGVIMGAPHTSTPTSILVSEMEQLWNRSVSTMKHLSITPPPSTTSNSSTDDTELTQNSTNSKPTRIIDHANNRTQHGYVYQIPITETQPRPDNTEIKQSWCEAIIARRLDKNMSLREWEWSAGESITSSDSDTENNTVQQHPYAERVKTFTYTRSDDPILKGRKVVQSKRRQDVIMWVDGDFGDEVDYPEYVPKEDEESDIRIRPFKNEYVQQQQEEEAEDSEESSESEED